MNEPQELPHVPDCYGCSPSNPVGLKMKFKINNDHVRGEFLSTKNHAGPPRIVHGGVVAALVDESLSICCRRLLKRDARTVKLEITFRNPAMTGSPVFVETRLAEEKSKVFVLKATVMREDGKAVAQAMGTMFKMKKTY